MTFVKLILLICGWVLLGATMADSAALQQFHIDAAASRVWFDADARLHTFRGQTQHISGRFTLQQWSPPQLADAKFRIDAASLKTGNSDRDADMRDDYLEVQRYPTIEFDATKVATARPTAAASQWDLVLQGKLMIHGMVHDVSVPMTVELEADRVTARGQLRLDIRDYGIRVPRLLFIPMKSEVLIGFDVVARPAS